MLAIDTDLATPKDVSAIAVTISTNNAVRHNAVSRVGPGGDVVLPATLAIVAPEEGFGAAVLQVRVIAFQDRRARILRDVRTGFPDDDRVALLRVPLRFVNDGSTTGELTDAFDPALFVPTCASPEETVIDGECRDARVDPASLAAFSPDLVGRADQPGSCFDVRACFATAAPVAALDPTSCSLPLGTTDASRLNLALVGPSSGVCLRPDACFVPLDRASGGWTLDPTGARVVLPPVVCRLVTTRGLALHQASGCSPKIESRPSCLSP
jgi:hypothetical protein